MLSKEADELECLEAMPSDNILSPDWLKIGRTASRKRVWDSVKNADHYEKVLQFENKMVEDLLERFDVYGSTPNLRKSKVRSNGFLLNYITPLSSFRKDDPRIIRVKRRLVFPDEPMMLDNPAMIQNVPAKDNEKMKQHQDNDVPSPDSSVSSDWFDSEDEIDSSEEIENCQQQAKQQNYY